MRLFTVVVLGIGFGRSKAPSDTLTRAQANAHWNRRSEFGHSKWKLERACLLRRTMAVDMQQ